MDATSPGCRQPAFVLRRTDDDHLPRADFGRLPCPLMAGDMWECHTGTLAGEDLEVGRTDGGGFDLNQDLLQACLRLGHVRECEFPLAGQYDGEQALASS